MPGREAGGARSGHPQMTVREEERGSSHCSSRGALLGWTRPSLSCRPAGGIYLAVWKLIRVLVDSPGRPQWRPGCGGHLRLWDRRGGPVGGRGEAPWGSPCPPKEGAWVHPTLTAREQRADIGHFGIARTLRNHPLIYLQQQFPPAPLPIWRSRHDRPKTGISVRAPGAPSQPQPANSSSSATSASDQREKAQSPVGPAWYLYHLLWAAFLNNLTPGRLGPAVRGGATGLTPSVGWASNRRTWAPE